MNISEKLLKIASMSPDSSIGIEVRLLAEELAKDERRRKGQRERTAKCRSKRYGNVTVTPEPLLSRYSNVPVYKKDIESKKERRLQASGSRLPPDWIPSFDDRKFATELGFTENEIDQEAAGFVDYWIAVPGSKGTKTNWPATWRNRVRSVLKFRKPGQPSPRLQVQVNNRRLVSEEAFLERAAQREAKNQDFLSLDAPTPRDVSSNGHTANGRIR
jgi:hypothetical protein